jgi:hypothetical protein
LKYLSRLTTVRFVKFLTKPKSSLSRENLMVAMAAGTADFNEFFNCGLNVSSQLTEPSGFARSPLNVTCGL